MLFFKKKNKKYLSCDIIEHGLDFFVDSITLCCRIPYSDTGFIKLIENYNGEIFDYKKLFKIKNKYRNMMRKGKIIPVCKNCVYLKEKEWDSDNYISFINFNNWQRCNEHCIYCELNDGDIHERKQYNVYPAIKDMAEKGYLRAGGHITIAGGEPSFAPEFNDLVDLLLKKGFDSVRVLTNATIYSEVIERGIKEGKVGIVVSVDSGSKELFKKIKRYDFYDIVWENIKKYSSVKKHLHSVKTKYIIIPDVNDIEEEINLWIQKSLEADIKEVALDIEQNWYDKNKNKLPERIFEITEYAINKIKENNLGLELIDRGSIIAKMIK